MKIKIKDIQGKFATGKYQLLDPDAKAGKSEATNRERGYRALEPGEVIEVDDKQAEKMVKASGGVLEITVDDVTRPLYFADIEEARLTSKKYNTDSPERADAKKKATKRVKEKVSEGNSQ